MSGAEVEVEEVTPEQGRRLFDKAARRLLGVSGDEFFEAYHTGVVPAEWPARDVFELEMLIRFAE